MTIRIIPVFFIVLYLQGCATVFTTRAAYELEYAKIENITKATECAEGTIYLHLQGKRTDQTPTGAYIVSLPKDIVSKYAVSVNVDFRNEDNPYLMQSSARSAGGKYFHMYRYSSKAIQPADQAGDGNCRQTDILPIQDPKICRSATHEINEYSLLANNSTTARIFSLPPCYRTEGMSIIIVPPGKESYPLELSGGGTEILAEPGYLLLIPFAVAVDVVTSPLQLLAILIEIGIHL